ncbi:MAG TPA: hypothetical protein VM364_18990 [Vicinamibacterales bacterium]|nr:hypothetical protein [Vicinamibacterales bacterium]HWI16260.1 hypothetical protein [Vicinamibacterales bacterium]
MSADRKRRRGVIRDADGVRDITTIDERAEEALRSLVRILARKAARELFAKSCVIAENPVPAEDQT